ncbi:MAG: tetratricopeptide repeat protein [Phycisphaerales bacterium]|nr:tetratricopeptide repeat protein [Phycisphaerales bacterium]
MPEGIKPETDVLALCRTMQDKVEQARRSSTDWRLTEVRILMKAADHQKALPVLEQLVRDEARNPMARFLLAQCLYHLKEMTKAREILDNLSSEVNSPEVLTLYGLVLMETDDLAVARDVLLRAMELKPEDPSPRRAYLMVQTKANQLEAAGSSVEDYYRKNPADPRAIRFKMQFEQIRNRRDELSTLMNKVQGLRPLTDEHVDILVDGYLFLQDIPSAAQYAQELARRRPDAIEAQLKLAQTLLMQNRDEEVKQLLVKLREKYPESGSADQMLGELYLQRQAFDRSVELMERVVEREPSNLEARFILARGLTGLAFFDEAIEQLDKVLESNPREARAHAMLARIHQATGRREKAAEHLAEINPNEVTESTSPALLAELKMRQGQMEEALDICNRALALGNTDPSIRQILASIYLNQKQYDQAEVNLLGLVRLQPNNAQAYALLTRFYIEQKRVEKGLAEITALQSINEPLSRLTQANLLMSLGRVEDAIERLRPIYEPLLRSRDARAILIADAMARAILVARRDVDAAIAVYEPMIQAGVQSALARLRQIDIHGTRETRPQVIARLESLANEIGPDDKRVRLELIRRLMDAQRLPMAIKLVEDWVSLQPGQNNLLRLKAEVLTRAGQADAAVTVLEQAVALAPEDETVRRQLAAVHVVRYDFPAAQQAYLETSKLDEGARINALADLGQMFVSLGLNAPATDVLHGSKEKGGCVIPEPCSPWVVRTWPSKRTI